jgi:hypothetical protein
MALNSKKRLLAAKVEASYGVAETLTGAECVLTKGLDISPFEGEALDRDLDRPQFGASDRIHVGTYVAVTFMVELQGSGALGTAPAFGDLLQGCHMLETVVAATSVEYTPDSDDTTSVTLRFNLDGIDHLIVGAMGSFKVKIDANQIPYLEFRFVGIYADPTATAALSPTGWTSFIKPEPISFAGTTAFQFYGITTGWQLRNFELDQGNQVEYFEGPGEQLVDITDRDGKGSLSTLLRAVGTFNPYAIAKANTTGALLITHGTVAANRWHLSAPSVQILTPKYGDDRNRALMQVDLAFVPTATGDDDFKLRFASAAA